MKNGNFVDTSILQSSNEQAHASRVIRLTLSAQRTRRSRILHVRSMVIDWYQTRPRTISAHGSVTRDNDLPGIPVFRSISQSK